MIYLILPSKTYSGVKVDRLVDGPNYCSRFLPRWLAPFVMELTRPYSVVPVHQVAADIPVCFLRRQVTR